MSGSGHSHSVLCLVYCPARKGKPWNTNEKFPTPHDLHKQHKREDRER